MTNLELHKFTQCISAEKLCLDGRVFIESIPRFSSEKFAELFLTPEDNIMQISKTGNIWKESCKWRYLSEDKQLKMGTSTICFSI